jgi:hypothetical protein
MEDLNETLLERKRTKKPFRKTISTVSHVTHEQLKTKECAFNPILQVYQKQEDEVRNHVITQERRAKSLVNHLVTIKLFRSRR